MKNIKQAYEEILEVVIKHKELGKQSEFRDIEEMIEKAENHLFIIDWNEKYGLNLKHDIQVRGRDYIKTGEYTHFLYFKDAESEKRAGYGMYISWEDDDKQPKDEWLFNISFSTGAYIFGDDCPTELFQEFWQELKSYNPKYCDSHNNHLYFSLESSSKISNEFKNILQKYYERNKEDFKLRKIAKLQKELESLQK